MTLGGRCKYSIFVDEESLYTALKTMNRPLMMIQRVWHLLVLNEHKRKRTRLILVVKDSKCRCRLLQKRLRSSRGGGSFGNEVD